MLNQIEEFFDMYYMTSICLIFIAESNGVDDNKSEAIEEVRNEKFRSPVHSIIKKPSSEKQARFSVANVTKEPGGHVESSNVKFQEEVLYNKILF